MPQSMMDRRQSEDEKSITTAGDVAHHNTARSVFEGDEEVAEVAVDTAAGPQYPTGFKFAMIFGGLLISMFLVALDMVCSTLAT